MNCEVCSCNHPIQNAAMRHSKFTDPKAQAERNVKIACELLAPCARALAERNNKTFDQFYFEEERVKIMWGGSKITIFKCNGMENGELMKIEDIQKRILKAYKDSCLPMRVITPVQPTLGIPKA